MREGIVLLGNWHVRQRVRPITIRRQTGRSVAGGSVAEVSQLVTNPVRGESEGWCREDHHGH